MGRCLIVPGSCLWTFLLISDWLIGLLKGRILQYWDKKRESNSKSYRFALSKNRNFWNSCKESAEKRKIKGLYAGSTTILHVRRMHEQKAFQELSDRGEQCLEKRGLLSESNCSWFGHTDSITVSLNSPLIIQLHLMFPAIHKWPWNYSL